MTMQQVHSFLNNIFLWLTYRIGWIYILTLAATVIFCFWVIFGKYSNVYMGKKSEKQYSEISWGAMIFCTGIASSMMILSFIAPLYYVSDPPFNLNPFSVEAYEYAHMYEQYGWGLAYWPLSIPIAIFIGYYMQVEKREETSLGSIFHNLGYGNRIVAVIVDAVAIISVLGGIGCSMGLSAPFLCEVLYDVFKLERSDTVMYALFLAWFAIYTISVMRGLNKGIKILSRFNVVLAMVFVFFVLCNTSIGGVIEAELNSIGLFLTHPFRLMLTTDPFGNRHFPQRWTVYYLAFSLVYAVIVGQFTAKISRGRTLRQVALGMLGYGTLGCAIVVSICGYYSLKLQQNGTIDLVEILNSQGKDAAMVEILHTLPFPAITELFFALVCFVFAVTTFDSTAYVLGMISSGHLKENEEPSKAYRLGWAIIFFALSLVITKIGGLETVQTLSIVTAFPMTFIIFFVMAAFIKIMRKTDVDERKMEKEKGADNIERKN